MTNSRAHPGWTLVVIWMIALVAAFTLDRSIATWVRDRVPVNKKLHRTHLILEAVKLPGWGVTTAGIAVMLGLFHRRHWQAAVALAGSAIGIGICYSVIKWVVGRHRPVIEVNPWGFHYFAGGFRGFWGEKALCFPSGHASLAFATASCLAILIPRFGWLFFLIATATAAERVLENAHYLSDVVAGTGLGIFVGWAVTREVLRRGIFDFSITLHGPADGKN